MICVGIDVAKDKHDCCILDSEGVILVEIAIFSNFDSPDKSLLTPDSRHLPTSRVNSQTAMRTWKNWARNTCAMSFTTQPSTFAIGILSLPNTLPRNVAKESITMSHFLMLRRNLCA